MVVRPLQSPPQQRVVTAEPVAPQPSAAPLPVAADLAEVPELEGLSQQQIQALANISFDQINEVYSQRMAEALATDQAEMDQCTKARSSPCRILQRNAARSLQFLGQLSQLS